MRDRPCPWHEPLLEMARRKARFASDRIEGKMRALAVHFTTVYIYALTLTTRSRARRRTSPTSRVSAGSGKQQTTVAKDELPLSPTECASINSCAAGAS